MKTHFAFAIISGMVLAAVTALPSLSHAMHVSIGANTNALVDLQADRSSRTASATVDGSVDVQADAGNRGDRNPDEQPESDNNKDSNKNENGHGFFGRIWAALNLNKGDSATSGDSSDNSGSDKDNVLNATGSVDAEVTVEGAPSLHFLRAVAVTDNSVKIKWLSSERSSAKVWVELDGDINTTVIPSGSQDSLSFFHNIKVENLEAGTTYHFKVESADRDGNATISTVGTFTTEVE